MLMIQTLDEHDLRARASEEALREGAIALAAIQPSIPRIPRHGAAGDSSKGSNDGVVWQRFAAAAAQGDAVLLQCVLFALSPRDVAAVFRHLLIAQIDCLPGLRQDSSLASELMISL